jgi:acetyltransferase-like isoleucine patch superfamily enzyme
MNNILSDNIHIGKNVIIDPSAIIRGVSGNAKNVFIGDNTYIGANVQIICDEFHIGDYCKIQHDTNIHGYLPCRIGHNAWIGQYTIIDSIGGMTIGNNCGIGAHSQLWSHIKFGDTLEGSRFESSKPMIVGNDVWFVGHCIVSPIVAADKSMAMAGSVVTKDMAYNHIYAGTPAVSLSDKIGYQFSEVSIETKFQKMTQYISESGVDQSKIKVVMSSEEIELNNEAITYFNLFDRTYTKRSSDEEVKFMKFLLPTKGKFIPL